jgi:hypothetical protein
MALKLTGYTCMSIFLHSNPGRSASALPLCLRIDRQSTESNRKQQTTANGHTDKEELGSQIITVSGLVAE